jgi:hypothetical protein
MVSLLSNHRNAKSVHELATLEFISLPVLVLHLLATVPPLWIPGHPHSYSVLRLPEIIALAANVVQAYRA